jgi:hypothetical protein
MPSSDRSTGAEKCGDGRLTKVVVTPTSNDARGGKSNRVIASRGKLRCDDDACWRSALAEVIQPPATNETIGVRYRGERQGERRGKHWREAGSR